MTKRARELSPADLEPGEIEILRLGDHHGAPEDLTLEDFDEIVADYDAEKVHRAQAVIDHDPADREPDDPSRKGTNHGLFDRVRRVKDSVVAHFENFTPELQALVNSGRLHAVTPEIYRAFRATGRKYLRAVAFVGADTPAQKGLLRPLLMHEGTPEASVAVPLHNPALSLGEGDPKMTKPAGTPNPDPNPNPTPGGPTNPPAPNPSPNPNPPAEPGKPTQPSNPPAGTVSMAEVAGIVTEAVEKAMAPVRDQVTKLNARLEESDPEFGDRAVVKFAEELVRDGKIEGKDRERTIARAKALRGQTLKFGEGAEAREVSALEDFMEQERSRPALPHFDALEVGAPNGNGRARAQNGVLKFAEGKKPKFSIMVPEDASKDEVARLTKLGEFAAENDIANFAEASVRFEREVEGIGAR